MQGIKVLVRVTPSAGRDDGDAWRFILEKRILPLQSPDGFISSALFYEESYSLYFTPGYMLQII